MTKDDFIGIINIKDSSRSYSSNSKLFCNNCNYNLALLDAKSGEWYCNHCHRSYFPNDDNGEKVRRSNKFTVPSGPVTPIVSIIDDARESSSVYNKEKLPPSLERMLKRPGVKLLSYSSSNEE